jgi:hypothetical protein
MKPGVSPSESRRADRAMGAVNRELRRPRNLVRYVRKSADVTTPLIFAGPTFVLLAYIVAFALTPDDRVGTEFGAAASQIIPVLLLVLAVEGQVFRWEISRSSLSAVAAEDLMDDPRFARYAAGEGPIGDALEAVVDAAADTARNAADALLRQVTALLLLGSMVVGEIIALVPLLTDDPGSTSAKPVMAAIVAGFAGVAYVAVTGSRFLPTRD